MRESPEEEAGHGDAQRYKLEQIVTLLRPDRSVGR